MDGANMNAQVGLTSPGFIGADVCHLNLHKTFCIPHGGGGRVGPICVAAHLLAYRSMRKILRRLTRFPLRRGDRPASSPFPLGLYRDDGQGWFAQGHGACHSQRLRTICWPIDAHFPVLGHWPGGLVAHECILDCRPFKAQAGVEVEDIAKRLMDYGFHAPTVSWPVAGTMMVEPTESEPKEELDRFAEAMIAIRQEIAAIEADNISYDNAPLHHAPHTAADVSTMTGAVNNR